MSDAHSRMIHYFESILFKGLIKPVDKPVNQFANQFELFVEFPAARTCRVVWSGSQLLTQELLHQERWRHGFGSTVSSKQICKLCKGYCLLAMDIYIRWTQRVLTTVSQVHSITVGYTIPLWNYQFVVHVPYTLNTTHNLFIKYIVTEYEMNTRQTRVSFRRNAFA